VVTHLQVVSVPVGDQDRAKAFYTEVLGFEVKGDMAYGSDQRWVELAPPGAPTSITLVTWFPSMAPGSLKGLVLNTDDIHATYDELAARGLTWHGPIQDEFWGTFATFDDPDGNGWVVAQSKGDR
jgi:uncharacterized glyoxalase superfamily protein PhnB